MEKKNQREKKLKSYRVEKKQSFGRQLWYVTDQYLTLFIVPLFVFFRAVVFLQVNTSGWEGLIAGIWILFAIISAILTGLFLLINYYVLGWKLNWWKNILLSVLIFIVGSFAFGLVIRMTS